MWKTLDELEGVLREALEARGSFRPRDWLVANMSDAICAAALYKLIMSEARS